MILYDSLILGASSREEDYGTGSWCLDNDCFFSSSREWWASQQLNIVLQPRPIRMRFDEIVANTSWNECVGCACCKEVQVSVKFLSSHSAVPNSGFWWEEWRWYQHDGIERSLGTCETRCKLCREEKSWGLRPKRWKLQKGSEILKDSCAELLRRGMERCIWYSTFMLTWLAPCSSGIFPAQKSKSMEPRAWHGLLNWCNWKEDWITKPWHNSYEFCRL